MSREMTRKLNKAEKARASREAVRVHKENIEIAKAKIVEEIRYFVSFNSIFSNILSMYPDYSVGIKQAPGEQRLIVLKEASIKRKLGAYKVAAKKNTTDIKNVLSYCINQGKVIDSQKSYFYDMQSFIIDVDHEDKVIYLIDGQQRATLHLGVNMYLNVKAMFAEDIEMHKAIRPLFSKEKSNEDNLFELHSHSKLSFNVDTINKISIDMGTKKRKNMISVSDYEYALYIYDQALLELDSEEAYEERFIELYDIHEKKILKQKGVEESIKNEALENLTFTDIDVLIHTIRSLSKKEDSRYIKYFTDLFGYIQEENFDTNKLFEATRTIGSTLNEKSPFETNQGALSRVGTKGEDMIASTFIISVLFQNTKNPELFNQKYEELMNSHKNTENKEAKNDTLFQIVASKYIAKFTSRSLNESYNTLVFFEELMAKYKKGEDLSLSIINEVIKMNELLSNLESKIKFQENLKGILGFSLKIKVVDQLFQLAFDNLIKEKSKFALLSIVTALGEAGEKACHKDSKIIENTVKKINLFFTAEKISINTLKDSEELFFRIGNLFFNSDKDLTEKCEEILTGVYYRNKLGKSIEDINKMFGSMAAMNWHGKEDLSKTISFISYIGFEMRLSLLINQKFAEKFTSYTGSSMFEEDYVKMKYSRTHNGRKDPFQQEHFFAKLAPTLMKESDKKDFLNNPAYLIAIRQSLNIKLNKKTAVEKMSLLVNNTDISALCCYFNPNHKLLPNNNKSSLKSFSDKVIAEMQKDFLIYYKDVITDYESITEEMFEISSDFYVN